MHMADALVSPAVGGTMWAVSAGLLGMSCRRVKYSLDDHQQAPLMGVLGAFTFAAQMINFAIPGTGSSGHLGGGLLLAVLLGPHAAFLTLASVLIVQAIFFADGGLLALGSNLFNLGFFPCFVAYPLIYRRITDDAPGERRVVFAALASAVVGAQLGALGVVVETHLSGITELPLGAFALMMQPIHLAIGAVEGLATAAVVLFVAKARPELLENGGGSAAATEKTWRRPLIAFTIAALLLGGVVSLFASAHPDGLEWAIERVVGRELDGVTGKTHAVAARFQEQAALLPDYDFKTAEGVDTATAGPDTVALVPGTSAAGIVGGLLTLLLAGLIAFLLRRRPRTASRPKETSA